MVLSSDVTQFVVYTYLGGPDSRTHSMVVLADSTKAEYHHAVCSGCQAFNATGHATSDFPTTENAWSRINGSGNCNNAAFKLDLASLKARIQTNSMGLQSP